MKFGDLAGHLHETLNRQRENWRAIDDNAGRVIAGNLVVAGFLITGVLKVQEAQFAAYPQFAFSVYATVNLLAIAVSMAFCVWVLIHRPSGFGLDRGSVAYADGLARLGEYHREIALAYERMLEDNSGVVRQKSLALKWGLRWAVISLALLALSVVRLFVDGPLPTGADLVVPISFALGSSALFLGYDEYRGRSFSAARLWQLRRLTAGGRQNRSASRRIVEEAYGRGKTGILQEIVGEEFRLHDPAAADPVQGVDGYVKYVESRRTGVAESTATIPLQIAERNLVATYFTVNTVPSDAAAVRPTVRTGIVLDRYERGTLVESWIVADERSAVPHDDEIMAVFEGSSDLVLSTGEVMTNLRGYAVDRETVLNRLRTLETQGLLRKKRAGGGYVWWVDEENSK